MTFAVALSPDGGRLLVGEGEADGIVRQWNPAAGQPIGPVLTTGPVKDIAWSSAGTTFLTGTWSSYNMWPGVRLGAQRWDAATGTPIGPLMKHGGDVWSVSYSPAGKTILTGSHDGTARLWDTATGRPSGEPLQHPATVRSAVFSPDGEMVLTAGGDGRARAWDIATRRQVGKVLAHPAELRWVAFSPDGQLVLTGCRDGFSRLWDFKTRRPLGPPLPQFGIVEKVAFAPDGKEFLTAGRDRTVRRWIVPSAVTGDAQRVRAWVETITRVLVDQNEAVEVMGVGAWRKRREQAVDFVGERP
jgi:WD40 repeat protein